MSIFGMDINVFATLCMAFIALLTLIFSVYAQWKHNKDVEDAEERHILELELIRVEKRYSEINNAGFNLWQNNINKYLIQLSLDIKNHDDYEYYNKQLINVIFEFKSLYYKYLNTIAPYQFSFEVSAKDSNDEKIGDAVSFIENQLYRISGVIIFFEDVSKKIGGMSFEQQQQMIKEEADCIDEKVSKDVNNMINNGFSDYCKENHYNYEEIKNNIGDDFLLDILLAIDEMNKVLGEVYVKKMSTESNAVRRVRDDLKMGM